MSMVVVQVVNVMVLVSVLDKSAAEATREVLKHTLHP
jgi:hypothetical protein